MAIEEEQNLQTKRVADILAWQESHGPGFYGPINNPFMGRGFLSRILSKDGYSTHWFPIGNQPIEEVQSYARKIHEEQERQRQLFGESASHT